MSKHEKFAKNFKGLLLAERTVLHLKNRISFETTVSVALALLMVEASVADLRREESELRSAATGRKR